MLNHTEKQKKFLLLTATCGVALFLFYLLLRYVLPQLAPFLIGFLIAWLLRKPSAWIAGAIHIRQKIPAAFLAAVFYILVGALVTFVGIQVISALKDLIPRLPDIFANQVMPLLNRAVDRLDTVVEQFDPDASEEIEAWAGSVSSSVLQSLSSSSASLVRLLSRIAMGMPSVILEIVLTIVATFFVAMDYERITGFIRKSMPEKLLDPLRRIKEKTVESLRIYVRSYTLIFLMTFAELTVGMLLLRVPYPVGVALLIAVMDLMPVLGTGLVLLPWALIAAVSGSVGFAIGMLVLYIAMTIVRNIVEPRLIGKQIGLHPLAALISMFVGLRAFGLAGLFLFPILLSLAVQLRRDGVIPPLSPEQFEAGSAETT